MRTLRPPKVKRGQKLKKKKPPNTINVDSQKPKIFLVCCSIVIRVQR